MLPGARTADGRLHVTAGAPAATDPRLGGFALKSTGEVYASAGGGGGFTPASLFANGEEGAWYDPSDLTTMFQDRAGTTPVTADGQTVGLILDKSEGLALGPELLTNGDFSNGTTGWSGQDATISVVGGKGRITGTSAGFSHCGTTNGFSTVIGRTYEVTCDFTKVNSTGYLVGGPTLFSTALGGTVLSTSGQMRLIFVATHTVMYVSVAIQCAVIGDYSEIDNFSVKELAGNHATAPSDAARPLYNITGQADWTNYDAVDDVLNTTFQSSLGSSCTVARANVGAAPTILTSQTIGTSYSDSTDNAGLIIVDRALTGPETADLTAWLTQKGAT